MTYQQRHIQATVDYVVNKLVYAGDKGDKKDLSHNNKKWVRAELMEALDPLQKRNRKTIAINKLNKSLSAFFKTLEAANIEFPPDVTYLLERGGKSYECMNGEKIEIYNRADIKIKTSRRRSAEIREHLVDDSYDDEYEFRSESESEAETETDEISGLLDTLSIYMNDDRPLSTCTGHAVCDEFAACSSTPVFTPQRRTSLPSFLASSSSSQERSVQIKSPLRQARL